MPIYEYQCQQCGHHSEEIQKFSDPPLQVCPNCGQAEFRKLVSQTSFQLKGSGWYVTDYKKSKSGGADKTDKKPKKQETKKQDSTKSD